VARRILILLPVLLLASVSAHAYVPPPDFCDKPVDYQTPDTVVSDPARPTVGQTVTYTAGGDPAYIKPGTMVFKIVPPSGATVELRPSTPDGQQVTYTPKVAGNYDVYASWQGRNCADPEQYAQGSAGMNYDIVAAAKPGTGAGNDEPLSISVSAAAAPGVVHQWGVKAAHRLPSNCRGASVWHHRRLNVSPPGKPNPTGVWVGYGRNTESVICPQVFAFRTRLSLVRSLLIEHMKGYVRFGGTGNVGHIKVGRYAVTTINAITEGYSDFVWRQSGITYSVEVLTTKGVPRLGGTGIKAIIRSFS
jgi:hypothetical protein